jgi:hypothetical protein
MDLWFKCESNNGEVAYFEGLTTPGRFSLTRSPEFSPELFKMRLVAGNTYALNEDTELLCMTRLESEAQK